MRLRRTCLALALGTAVLTGLPALADSAGTTEWPEEPSDSGEEDEEEEEEEEKGCAHVLMPQNLAVFGAGVVLFAIAARRGREE